MDSNKIQNEQTNTFSGGMNTDAADHVLSDDQYRDALNLRYVNNKESSSGSLKVIDGFKTIYTTSKDKKEEIIETTQIGQYGIFFTEDQDYNIYAYRFPLEKKQISNDDIVKIFGPCNDWNIYESDENKNNRIRNRLSIIGRQERPDNIKLYIADGIHQILIIDVLNDQPITSVNDISTNSYESLLPPKITDITYGSLKAGKNQYAFQFYSKYKQQTSMSPLSRLINIVNIIDGGYEFNGANEGNFTNMGVKLKIQIPDDSNYDLIKIYRVYYQQNSETPDIDLIFDGRFISTAENNKKYFYHIDSSNNSINKISVDDFNSKFGLYMIPRVIESKDDYLFAAQIKEYRNTNKSFDNINTISISSDPNGFVQFLNVNDDYENAQKYTITDITKDNWKKFDELTKEKDCWNPYIQNEFGINNDINALQCLYTFPEGPDNEQFYGGSGKHVDWKFITTILPADNATLSYDEYGALRPSIKYSGRDAVKSDGFKYYIKKDGTLKQAKTQFRVPERKNDTYQNPMVVSQLLSLRRGETYRYGIIFTDKKGISGPVKWIADITVPDLYIDGFQTFMNNIRGRELSVMPIGIEFKIHDIDNDDIYYYEIVRCNRGSNDIRIISQGVLSRPVIKKFMDDSVQKAQYYTPSGFVTTNRLNIDPIYNINMITHIPVESNYRVNNFSNQNLFQFISPEFSYTNKSTVDFVDRSNVKLDILRYLFSLNPNNRIVEQSITIDAIHGIAGETIKYESFNTTDFICNKGEFPTKFRLSPFEIPTKDDQIQIDTNNPNYINALLYNNLTMYNQINDIYGTYYAFINHSDDLRMTLAKYSVNAPADAITSTREYRDIEEAQKIKYQYFKLYCQSNSVLVNDNDPLNQYNTYSVTQDGKLTGYDIVKHDVKNQYGINSKQVSESLKWNDLFEVKKDKTEQKFSDKLDLVGEYGFCNVVCWGWYNEQPKGINKKEIHLIDLAMHALGGTSLLITTDGILKKQLEHNDKLLSETIGTDNILIMKEKVSDGIFTTETITEPNISTDPNNPTASEIREKITHEYVYKVDNTNQITGTYINASSFGTFLCNIVRNCIPYGGYTKTAKDNSKYYSYSDIKEFKSNENNIIDVFNGDTYIGPFEYTSAHKVSNRVLGVLATMNVQYSIPVESSINMYIDHGYKFSRNTNNLLASWLQEQPSNVDGVFKQTIPQYSYNTAYSLTKTIGYGFSTISYDTKDKQSYPYRCRYSEKKENGEIEDSWQNFKAANYIDTDPNYGKITGLKRFKNNLMFWQERAFGAFSVNERTAISDSSNHEILLGSGGMLSRYDYVSTTSGLEDNVFAYAITTQSIYWIDAFNTVFCQYNGGGDYRQISIIKNINTAVFEEYRPKKDRILKNKYKVLINPRYNEVYFASLGGSFVFNEIQQVFTSTYDYRSRCDSIIGKYDTFIANANNNECYTIDSLSGDNYMIGEDKMEFKLSYIINAQPNFVKVFDNVRFGATEDMAKQFESIYFVFDGSENTQSTDFVNPSRDISNRYYDYRYAIPRINDGSNQLYGNRLKCKSVNCEVSGDIISKNMQLDYITTKFRILWS